MNLFRAFSFLFLSSNKNKLAQQPRLSSSSIANAKEETARGARPFTSLASSSSSSSSSSEAAVIDGRTMAHYQKAKGVIFDIDGTLADSWKLGFDATLAILEKYGIPLIDADEYHSYCIYATPERLARHAGLEPGGDNHDEFERVGAQLAQEFDDLYVGLVSLETAGFYNDVTSMIQEIPAHVKLGALTNAAVKYADAVLEVNCPVFSKSGGRRQQQQNDDQQQQKDGVHYRFRSIRGADNVPEPKPSGAGLLQVCEDLGLSPEDCVYVGDSPTDGLAAEAAGMPSIGVLWGSHKEESLRRAPFTHLCRTVPELQELLPQNPDQ